MLGAITALIVARAQVVGEDPGLLTPLSGTAALVLNVGWVLVAVGWAVWRMWTHQTTWRVSGVEVALLALVVMQFVSGALAASYKRPAWLIGWEWGILVLAFLLVRQLAIAPGDNRGLLAAVVATGISLSAYAVYQYHVEFPLTRMILEPRAEDREAALTELTRLGLAASAEDPEFETWARRQRLRTELAKQNVHIDLDDPQIDNWVKRAEMANAYGTFAHPNSFAGYLALLLPVLVGWTCVANWRGPSGWLLAGACLLMATALWLTHSRGALLGVLVGLGGLAIVVGRARIKQPRLAVAIAAALVVGLGVLGWLSGSLTGKETRTASYRLDYWSATWSMIRDHPWLGVGPGNFGRAYPRYMAATAVEKIQDPHNFALEIWATSGLLGLIALFAALGFLLWHTRRAWFSAGGSVVSADSPAPYDPSLRWTFYLGGVAGLLIGFILRGGGLTKDDILMAGLAAGGSSLIWFAAFALLDSLSWRGSARIVAILAGVAALFVNLSVSGGVSFPAVVLPLWILVAITLNSLEVAPFTRSLGGWAGRYLPVPLTAGIAIAYWAYVFHPVTSAAAEVGRAHEHTGGFVARRQAAEAAAAKETLPAMRSRALSPAAAYLSRNILDPLARAVLLDPSDATPLSESAQWCGELWKLDTSNQRVADKALALASLAQRLDPEGKEGYLVEQRLRTLFAENATGGAKEHFAQAVSVLRALVRLDPTEARLRYDLADALYKSGNTVDGRREAEEASRLDELAVHPARKLNDRQREQIHKWLAPATSS